MNKCRVLLADDESTILDGYKLLFDWEKYHCEIVGTVMDGEEAIEKAKDLQPDLIIMDINLPKINGLDAIRKIQEVADDKHPIYTIVVTGYDDFSYCQEALRLRVTDFLLKPIDFEDFEKVISMIVPKILDDSRRRPKLSSTLSKIIEYIDNNISNDSMSLNRVATEINMNPNYISQLFKKEMGIGYHAYLKEARIEKAKMYLLKSNEPITTIAEMVGFGDYRIFTKNFKDAVGETPSSYRRKH